MNDFNFKPKPFDLVEHENGTFKLVVSIEEEIELSSYAGGGDQWLPLNYKWNMGGYITKIWRPISRGNFGKFLTYGFSKEYFNLVWQRDEKTVVTLQEIADKFGVDVSELRIKE